MTITGKEGRRRQSCIRYRQCGGFEATGAPAPCLGPVRATACLLAAAASAARARAAPRPQT